MIFESVFHGYWTPRNHLKERQQIKKNGNFQNLELQIFIYLINISTILGSPEIFKRHMDQWGGGHVPP